MFDTCRLKGRLFYCLLTAFLVSVVAMWTGVCPPVAMAASPVTTTVSEGLFGTHAGAEKKASAVSFLGAAMQIAEAIERKEIVDEASFKRGMELVIDGTVLCLNASSWSQVKE